MVGCGSVGTGSDRPVVKKTSQKCYDWSNNLKFGHHDHWTLTVWWFLITLFVQCLQWPRTFAACLNVILLQGNM